MAHDQAKVREIYCILLGCKGEIDILMCKKWAPIHDINLKVNLPEKRLDNSDLYYKTKSFKHIYDSKKCLGPFRVMATAKTTKKLSKYLENLIKKLLGCVMDMLYESYGAPK